MTDEELCKQLRRADEYEPLGHDGWEAADRIEALVRERGEWHILCREALMAGYSEHARAQSAEAALKAMCEEFRGHDLPYGSKAYVQATDHLAKYGSQT